MKKSILCLLLSLASTLAQAEAKSCLVSGWKGITTKYGCYSEEYLKAKQLCVFENTIACHPRFSADAKVFCIARPVHSEWSQSCHEASLLKLKEEYINQREKALSQDFLAHAAENNEYQDLVFLRGDLINNRHLIPDEELKIREQSMNYDISVLTTGKLVQKVNGDKIEKLSKRHLLESKKKKEARLAKLESENFWFERQALHLEKLKKRLLGHFKFKTNQEKIENFLSTHDLTYVDETEKGHAAWLAKRNELIELTKTLLEEDDKMWANERLKNFDALKSKVDAAFERQKAEFEAIEKLKLDTELKSNESKQLLANYLNEKRNLLDDDRNYWMELCLSVEVSIDRKSCEKLAREKFNLLIPGLSLEHSGCQHQNKQNSVQDLSNEIQAFIHKKELRG